MAVCYLCSENDRGTWCYYCDKCNKIKRMISLYGLERVYEILECVLIRNQEQQNYKIKNELEKEKKSADEKLEASKIITRSTKQTKP